VTTLNAGYERFKGSAFHQRINDAYKDGIVVAADPEKIIAQAVNKITSREGARQVEGKTACVMNLRHFVVRRKWMANFDRAALTLQRIESRIATRFAAPGLERVR